MSENILFVYEKKESNIGDALIARNMAMTNFIGLGPPDLVVLEKNYTPPKLLIGAKQAKHSYFHWTLGNDVSSSAAVATYLGFLLENQEKSALGRGTFSIDKCYTCSYNAFRKMDLRVEITVPEPARKHNGYSIDAYAVDAVGNRHELDDLFWKETHVCAMLRLIEGPPQALRPIKIKDALNDPAAEAHFLSLCTEVFPQARKLGNPENGYSLYGVDASNNLLTSMLCKYFIQHNRFEHMLAFFDNFTNADPVVSVPISYAEAMLDKSPRALTLLDSSLRRKPDSASIMLSMAELSLLNLPMGLDRHIKLLDTLKTTLNGIALQPNLARGWWILAKCLIEMNRYEWSLVVMNNAPVVNEDFAHRLVDAYGNPLFDKFTNPEVFVNHILTILQDEESSFRDEEGDASLRLLAAPTISPDEKTVYALLSDIISRSSWDHLTKIRTRVLVRPSEMEKAKNRFLRSELQSSASSSSTSSSTSVPPTIIVPTTAQQLRESATPVEVVTPFVPPATVNAVEQSHSQSESDEDQKDEGKSKLYESTDSDIDPSHQQSSEFSPMQRSTRESLGMEEKKEAVEQQSSELGQTQEILASSVDSAELQDVSISSERQFSTPSFSISRDLDVDDALTKFLVYVLASRAGVPTSEISTTPMNIEVASSPMIPVKEISRNVDVAFHAIFQDIKAFHAWKEEEKKLNLVGTEDLPAKLIPTRSVADWIRIAAMCERLSFSKDAAKIYKMLEHKHIKALSSIVTLDAARGDIKSTLLDASALLARYSALAPAPPQSVPSLHKLSVQQPHPVVVNAVVKLIASQGAHKVRNMQSSMPYLHPLLPPIVQDTVRWKSKGFDA